MIHQPSSGTQGKVTDQEITLKEAIELKERLAAMMAKNTGQKLAKVKADMERDFWMSAEDAVKYGVVDTIVSSPKK
jgi:ATP-dependent Clp protease protease subunit